MYIFLICVHLKDFLKIKNKALEPQRGIKERTERKGWGHWQVLKSGQQVAPQEPDSGKEVRGQARRGVT